MALRVGRSNTADPGPDPAAPEEVLRPSQPARNVARGVVMGLADAVPGVSGGTMALLLGIYDRFISALASLHPRLGLHTLRIGSHEGRKGFLAYARSTDLWFLVQLAIGIGGALVLGAHLLGLLLTTQSVALMALFFGLILASARIPWRRIPHTGWRHGLALLVGTGLAASTVLLPASDAGRSLPFLFVSGAIAITAMLLPGISGAALLVLLGAYETVILAVRDLDLLVIAVFGAGAVVGLLLGSRGIRSLLRHRHDITMATLTGLMLGSLVRVWPWRDTPGFGEGLPVTPDATVLILPTLLILAGILLSVGLERVSVRPRAAPS